MGLLDRLVDGGIDPKRLMPGTGACALTDAARITTHAVKRGVGGVLMLPPFYYKGVSEQGLSALFSQAIQRAASDKLRLYLYHIPPAALAPSPLARTARLAT